MDLHLEIALSVDIIKPMEPVLAMGDIAGPTLFYSLLICDGLLLVAVGLLTLPLRKRSLVAVVIACILMLIASFIGITFIPLTREAFYTLSTDDLDAIHWIYRCRVVSVIWVAVTVVALTCFARVIQKWKSKE